MSSPSSQSPKDFVELTPVFRGGENEQRKFAKVRLFDANYRYALQENITLI